MRLSKLAKRPGLSLSFALICACTQKIWIEKKNIHTWHMIHDFFKRGQLSSDSIYDQLTTWHMTCMSHDLTTYDQIPNIWHIWPRMTKYMTLYMTYMTMYDKIYDYIYDIYMTRYDQIWPHDIYMTTYMITWQHTTSASLGRILHWRRFPPADFPPQGPPKENVAIKQILKSFF